MQMEFRGSGFTVGRYEIGQRIGSGSSAKVKLGRHVESGQEVAIKIFRRDQGSRYITLLKQEVEGLRVAAHPNVIKFVDMVATQTTMFLILEYAAGRDLLSVLSGGRLQEATVRKYFQQLITAVNHCHSKGVFHRDLKPENLLLDREGNLKVADFGLCAFSHQLKNGLLFGRCGTMIYLAPEAINGQGHNGATADFWACGVILFFMLADTVPFDMHDPGILRKIAAADYVLPEGLSRGVEHLIKRLLDPVPRTRITGAEILKHKWFKQDYHKAGPQQTGVGEPTAVASAAVEAARLEQWVSDVFRSNFEIILSELRPTHDFQHLAAHNSAVMEALIPWIPGGRTSKKVFFTSRFPARGILEKLEQSATLRGFQVRRENETLHMNTTRALNPRCMNIGRGVCATAVVYELTPYVAAVVMHKTKGHTLSSQKFWEQFCKEIQVELV